MPTPGTRWPYSHPPNWLPMSGTPSVHPLTGILKVTGPGTIYGQYGLKVTVLTVSFAGSSTMQDHTTSSNACGTAQNWQNSLLQSPICLILDHFAHYYRKPSSRQQGTTCIPDTVHRINRSVCYLLTFQSGGVTSQLYILKTSLDVGRMTSTITVNSITR